MNIRHCIYILVLLMVTVDVPAQSIPLEINDYTFSLISEKLDTLEQSENKVIKLYRGNKELLSHTIVKEEGDCSSITIELGSYSIVGNEITFYSYWAAADRKPGSPLPYGFRKQIYSVDKEGALSLTEATIYIEDYVDSVDRRFFEGNGWRHKGLNNLNSPSKSETELQLLNHYKQCIEKKYKAIFLLNDKKEKLEKEVRLNLKSVIEHYTKDWVAGEIYGRVKK